MSFLFFKKMRMWRFIFSSFIFFFNTVFSGNLSLNQGVLQSFDGPILEFLFFCSHHLDIISFASFIF